MNDLTVLFYTSNLVDERFAENVRKSLLECLAVAGARCPICGAPSLLSEDDGGFICDNQDCQEFFERENETPIISVSQKPINLGHNICVGEIGATVYNVYKQILIGAKEATTKFCACAEDDTLYCAEHFTIRPPASTFAYNMNRWILDPDPIFRYRERTGMNMCIVETEYLVDTLEERFAAYPDPIDGKLVKGWGEPGRYEKNLHLPLVSMVHFRTDQPCMHFNHKASLRGIRSKNSSDILKDELPPWGTAKELWSAIHG